MNFSAYHSHTNFSDGKNTMEEMVQAAIALGMDAIGISDHSFTPCDTSYCMKLEDYPAYLAELDRVKAKYADRITVLRGIELDYDSDPAITENLDYFLGSVHYLLYGDCERVYAIDHAPSEQYNCVEREHGGDVRGFIRDYFDTVVRHIEATRPTIVGHFDVISKFSEKYDLVDESDPFYQKTALEALEAVLKVTPVVEVNTGAISRNWRTRPYPADFLLKAIKEMGGELVLGADTHAVDTITCFFPESVEIIKNAGFDHILTLHADGFRPQPLK